MDFFFVGPLEHFHHGSLDDLHFVRRNPQCTLLAVALQGQPTPRGLRAVRAMLQTPGAVVREQLHRLVPMFCCAEKKKKKKKNFREIWQGFLGLLWDVNDSSDRRAAMSMTRKTLFGGLVSLLLFCVTQSACNACAQRAPLVFHVLAGDDVRIETRPAGAAMDDLVSDPQIVFATNGGIFERPEAATGLLISGGKEVHPINLANGSGNFFLKPNGILFRTTDARWRIVESEEFEANRSKRVAEVTDATQSGPMILRKGNIHSAIQPSSPNKLLRNGACVDAEGNLHLLMTRGDGTFYDIARAAIEIACTDALYLDGVISSVLHHGIIEPPENRVQRYASIIVVRRRLPPVPLNGQ
jgi:uncharacterized protein YigE (DUF2233 family)